MGKDAVIVAFAAVLVFACSTLTVAQWNAAYPNNYVTYNPQLSQSPTFSNLNTYTTPFPFTNRYNTQNLNQNQIRIWPYVMGQYLYPQRNLNNNFPYNINNNLPYNNNNNYVPYNNNNNNNNANWPYGNSNTQQSWYSAIYPYGQT